LLKTLLLAVLFSCIHGRVCFAAATYTVTQLSELTFGTLQIPSGPEVNTISTAGALTGSGTLLYGTVSAGDFTIKCTGICTGTLTISVATSTLCTGVNAMGLYQGNYNHGVRTGALPFGGLANPGAAGLDFKLGASVDYNGSVSAGSCPASFTIAISDSNGNNGDFPESTSLAFDVGLALTKNSDINFGTVTALNASTYRISTVGALSTVSGTGVPLYGATAASNIQIVGSATDGINISAGGYTANNGVTPSNAQCSYNGGAAGSCSISGVAPGAGKTLLVGVDVATDGTQAAGTTAAPTFTISVAYQ